MKSIKITYLLFFLLICQISIVLAQKKDIDSNAYASWSSVGGGIICNNGKYVIYNIENKPIGGHTLIVQSTENSWKKSFIGAKGQRFSSTKRGDYAIFLNQKDSLVVVCLGKDLIRYIPNVGSFSICRNEKSEWIAYQLKQKQKELVFQNLNTGKIYAYSGVINKVMGDDGHTVILQSEKEVDNQTLQELSCIDLSTGKSSSIWKGLKVQGVVLDTKHRQLAFTSEKGLFFYNMVMHKLKCLIDNQTTHLDSGLKLEKINRFSHDGDKLFIELKEEEKPKLNPGKVEIWSYLDTKIQTLQGNGIEARTYATVVNLMNGKVTRLEKEFEHLASNSFADGSSDTIRLITRSTRSNEDWYNANDNRYYLISLNNGKRIPFKYPPSGLSPQGKYVVYLDPNEHAYVSYNIKTGASHIISRAFLKSSIERGFDERGAIAGWLEGDEGVLFYDNYDIWKMDLSGQKAPINLTSRYGSTHRLIFSIIYGQYYPYPLEKAQKIILTTFNLSSKKNGFYSLDLDKIKDPENLSMGDYIYYVPPEVQIEMENRGFAPVKAKNAEVYLVMRMRANETPNYFSTKDFKTFKALSNVYPEREYKWYTSELHVWDSLDGKRLQGILYKPENFDPHKKYPLIFNYYESKSNNLNAYLRPQALYVGGNIDIPTYLNNGYLVFTPDIVYKIGDPMQGTYDAVISAAKYISKQSYVDPTKMGIQGFSWGGIQTDYLVTHTTLFAAACSTSGIADLISHYGRLTSSGEALQEYFEAGQIRMGKSFWEIPDAYIKNSSIFQLDKVTTPFLIMHTKKDGLCSYEDAVELFNGLRRLGKKSWMIAYPESNHGLYEEEAKDFSIRMMQFFDHYLKDKPAPIWMTRGISAERRRLDDGLAYDTKMKTPGPGLLTPDKQHKVDSLMTRKPILMELK